MPRPYSTTAKKQLNATRASDSPVTLLEIDHPDLVTPVRVVNYSEDIPHLGNTFIALAFALIPPDDLGQGLPRASISIDNIGKDLTSWVESSNGGRGSTARMIQVLPSDPDTIEWELTMNLENVRMTSAAVTADLSFNDVLNLPGVALRYTPTVAPGLY